MRTRTRLIAPALLALLLLPGLPGTAASSWRATADSLYFLAEAEFSAGSYSDAAGLYERVIELVEANDGTAAGPYFAVLVSKSRFLAGRSHEYRKKWDAAIEAYTVSLSELGPISDAVRLRLARCHRKKKEFGEAADMLREILEDGRKTPLDRTAVEQLGDSFYDDGDWGMALQWYRLFLAEAASYNERARAHYKVGLTYSKRRDEDAARESFALAVEEYPRSRYAHDALKAARKISKSFTDRYHQGLVLYNRKHFGDAREFFEYYLKHDPEKKFETEASYFLGRSHQRRRSYRTAAKAYEEVIALGGGGEYYELAWSKLAYCLRVVGRVEEGLATYDRYVELHPDGGSAALLQWEKGRLLEEEKRWDEAALTFRGVADRYPSSEMKEEALFRAGLCLFKLEDYDRAEEVFADLFLGSEPEEPARTLYWAGKSREELGDANEAVERFIEASEAERDSYYGRRSFARIEAERGEVARRAVSGGGRPDLRGPDGTIGWSAELLDFSTWLAEWYEDVYLPATRQMLYQGLMEMPGFARADLFLALHMRGEALAELELVEDVLGSDPRMLDVLVNYYEKEGLHKPAIRIAERLLAISPAEQLSDAPIYLRKKICPKHFSDIVIEECEESGLDPNLFFSLMRQESLFEPEAVSWAGAHGLSQIMPSTGRGIARRLGVRGFRTNHLLRPETNVRFGTYYLAGLIEDFDGDILRALAAYNGGPDNAERWWGYGGGRDSDVFVEDIGFSETNDYVRIVYRYYGIYREIYGTHEG